jgi:hypothetical protein
MAPLVKLLLNDGVTYTRFTNALKKSFLEAAPDVLETSGSKVNDSSVSTLTGIHRKDVREWRTVGEPLPQAKSFSAVMAVFTRWANDPEFCDKKGHPRILDRLGSTGTFESLASKVTNDVRPLALLQEMMRLGVASKVTDDDNAETDKVRLCMEALVPKQGSAELLQLFSDNVGDHLAAAVHNLSGGNDPMLEQSIYADNLRPESVAEINALSRKIWAAAFQTIVSNATVVSDKDEGQAGANQRLRVGMYFYHGPNLEP